ncbi:MAG: hypothetical protein HDT23_01400 [Ruminococcus sp.]|nr:hypothetical protein [Ruminococcus sp.]
MTGTGSEKYPFIVDNWADSENKVINFRNIKPEGFSETLKFPTHVDFNGWTLRNFQSTADVAIYSDSGEIKNLNLQNFYLSKDTEDTVYFLKAVNMAGCAVCGTITSDNAVFCEENILQSSINIKTYIKNRFILVSLYQNKNYIKNSNICIDINASEIRFSNLSNSIINNIFSEKINCNTNVILQGGVCNIYNLKSNRNFSYNENGISVYNSDLAINKTSTALFKACTTEQLKDPEYLYNLGFPVRND